MSSAGNLPEARGNLAGSARRHKRGGDESADHPGGGAPARPAPQRIAPTGHTYGFVPASFSRRRAMTPALKRRDVLRRLPRVGIHLLERALGQVLEEPGRRARLRPSPASSAPRRG